MGKLVEIFKSLLSDIVMECVCRYGRNSEVFCMEMIVKIEINKLSLLYRRLSLVIWFKQILFKRKGLGVAQNVT